MLSTEYGGEGWGRGGQRDAFEATLFREKTKQREQSFSPWAVVSKADSKTKLAAR